MERTFWECWPQDDFSQHYENFSKALQTVVGRFSVSWVNTLDLLITLSFVGFLLHSWILNSAWDYLLKFMQTKWMVSELSSVFLPETVKGSVWWLTVNLALIYRQIDLKTSQETNTVTSIGFFIQLVINTRICLGSNPNGKLPAFLQLKKVTNEDDRFNSLLGTFTS